MTLRHSPGWERSGIGIPPTEEERVEEWKDGRVGRESFSTEEMPDRGSESPPTEEKIGDRNPLQQKKCNIIKEILLKGTLNTRNGIIFNCMVFEG